MKKLILLLAVTSMIGLGSCKLNWRCQCVDKDGNVANTQINGGTFIHAEHTCRSIDKSCSLITEDK